MELVTAEEFSPSIETDPRYETAKEAKALLGYDPLHQRIHTRISRSTDMQKLLAVMREHGVRFYRPEDVESYKQKAQDKVGASKFWFRATLFVLFLLTLGASIYLMVAYPDHSRPHGIGVGAFIIALAGGFNSLCGIVNALGLVGHWVAYSLGPPAYYSIKPYTKEVPVTALERALALKKGCPIMRFEVHELKVEHVPLDPMLFACLGDAKLCIAVWDEPGFDSALTD